MFKKAMEVLEKLSKSGKPGDDLEALTKALQEELGEGIQIDLRKSEQTKTAEEAAEELRKAQEKEAEAAEELRKSQEDKQNEDNLYIEASEAYADLQKSVETGTNATLGELDVLKKAVGSLLNLNMKLAEVVGELSKSRKEDMEEIKKSMTSLGAGPTAPNAARLGTGSADEGHEELKKSVADTMEELTKAVQAGKVAARFLSDFGTYKDVERLPADVREIIGA